MSIRFLVLGPMLWLSACGDGSAVVDGAADLPPPSPGVYAGTFPCADCPGIEVTLWLHEDGRFFLRQRYRDTSDAEVPAYNLGRWRWSEDRAELVLAGAGPPRRFKTGPDGRLEMMTSTGLAHLLEPDPRGRTFDDRIGIDGLAVLEDGRLRVTECLTGLTAAVHGGADEPRLRQRLLSLVGRGAPALVELEVRYDWSGAHAPALAVERFFSIEPEATCGPGGP